MKIGDIFLSLNFEDTNLAGAGIAQSVSYATFSAVVEISIMKHCTVVKIWTMDHETCMDHAPCKHFTADQSPLLL